MRNNKTLHIIALIRNKTETKIPLLGFEPGSLFLSETEIVTSTRPIRYKIAVLLKYKLHNKNVKIREKKGEKQQQK